MVFNSLLPSHLILPSPEPAYPECLPCLLSVKPQPPDKTRQGTNVTGAG